MNNVYTPHYASTLSEQRAGKLSKRRSRTDGRGCLDFRPIYMKTGVVSQSSGSAYVEFGRTKVICSVHGAKGGKSNREFSDEGEIVCDVKYSPFAVQERRDRGQNNDELQLSSVVEQALRSAVMLERLPKSIISIYVVILEADGAEQSAAIIGASTALADAGIDMYGLVSSCSAVVIGDEILLDPEGKEVEQAEAHVTFSLIVASGQVTQLMQTGTADENVALQLMELCHDGCEKVLPAIVACLEQQAKTSI